MNARKPFIGLIVMGMLAAAGATTIIPMSVEKLAEISSDVIVGQAGKSRAEWNSQHTMIVTYTEFTVENRLKGSAQNVITVKQPGGSAEGYTQHVAGVRSWSTGESAVLFLRPSSANDGAFTISGLMQGDFRLRHSASGEAVADNGIAAPNSQVASNDDVQSFNSRDRSLTPYRGNRMNLSELERRVKTAISTQVNP